MGVLGEREQAKRRLGIVGALYRAAATAAAVRPTAAAAPTHLGMRCASWLYINRSCELWKQVSGGKQTSKKK